LFDLVLELYHRFIEKICNKTAIFFIVAAFELNLLKTAKPFVERWMRKQLGFRAFLRKVKVNLPYWAEKFPDFPDLIYLALQKYTRHR